MKNFVQFLDIKSVQNIEEKYCIKIIFQQCLLIVSFILFLSFLICGYIGEYAQIPVNDLNNYDVSIRVYRALFPVFMTWYIFASIWAIKTGCDFIMSQKTTKAVLLILSFIPVMCLANIFISARYVNRNSIAYYKDLLFTQDSTLKHMYRWGSWRRYVLLGMLIIMSPVIVYVFLPDSESYQPANNYNNNIWFYSFNYFTIQTNLMCFWFVIVSFACPGLKVFKNNNLQITLMVYIFIVGTAWNTLLLPADIASGAAGMRSVGKWVITSWYHILNPLLFITCGSVLIFKQPFKQQTPFSNIFRLGLVYPLMYLTFVAIVPFTAGVSIYGKYTNVNPNLTIDLGPNATASGSYANFAVVIGFWFLFLFFIWLLWFLDTKINHTKITANKIENLSNHNN